MGIIERHSGDLYFSPTDLSLTELPVRRALVIGTCVTVTLPQLIEEFFPECECDHIGVGNVAQIGDAPHPIHEYDFQIVQLSLRCCLTEGDYLRLPANDLGAHESLFARAEQRLQLALREAMQFNTDHGLLSFVSNFFVPMTNLLGRLLPRYDLRNPVHFLERLNQSLAKELEQYKNAYLFDLDQLSANMGRRNVQDDAIYNLSHNGILSAFDFDFDQNRIEPVLPIGEYYPTQGNFTHVMAREIRAMYRTVRQADSVKLVVIDLDDTLWRGVLAEEGDITSETLEGWPLGFIEALCFLKKRGILLAIISKNDEEKIVRLWEHVLLDRLSLEDFAVRKISWSPKADSMEELLQEINLLPRNVLFIDDNPVEREAMKAAFPEIRVMGAHPYLWKRILLWSSETQVPFISDESARRTEMIQQQGAREAMRRRLTRKEFLASLELSVTLKEIDSVEHSSFRRAFELTNKTNQFNTTGMRWTLENCRAAFADGVRFYAFDVQDRFVKYGLVGVAIVVGSDIMQFVMSCRVIGLDVEIAVLACVCQYLRRSHGMMEIRGGIRHTDANRLSSDLYGRCGFAVLDGGLWVLHGQAAPDIPDHVTITGLLVDTDTPCTGSMDAAAPATVPA